MFRAARLNLHHLMQIWEGFHSHGGSPGAGWFTIENLIKMDDLGFPPLFQETLISIPLYIYQVTLYQALCKEHRCRAYRMSCFQFIKMGWCWRLGGIAQETPVNQEKKQKTVSYKMPATGSLPSPNANHFVNVCLIKWLVWNYLQLDTYPHSPGNAPLLFSQSPKLRQHPIFTRLPNYFTTT